MNYNLSELADSSVDIPLPQIVERLGTQREYRKNLRKILKDTGVAISDSLLRLYALSYEQDSSYSEEILLAAVLLTLKNSTQRASALADELLRVEVGYLDQKFFKAVSRLTGVDVGTLASLGDNREILEQIVARNISFIKSLEDQTRSKIEQAVIDAKINNQTPGELKKELRKILGKQASRADLIANDQLEKLAADILIFRAEQAGLNEYIWRSVMDGRERSLHHYLHGKKQNADNPNHGDKGRFPRQPINCRCWMQWIIKAGKILKK